MQDTDHWAFHFQRVLQYKWRKCLHTTAHASAIDCTSIVYLFWELCKYTVFIYECLMNRRIRAETIHIIICLSRKFFSIHSGTEKTFNNMRKHIHFALRMKYKIIYSHCIFDTDAVKSYNVGQRIIMVLWLFFVTCVRSLGISRVFFYYFV